MTIYDFCKFFDFTFSQGDFSDGDDTYKYIATDDQGVFHERLANDINDFIDMFESMEPDYCMEPLEYDGFIYDDKANTTYYDQAYRWIKATNYGYTYLTEVIAVFTGKDILTL